MSVTPLHPATRTQIREWISALSECDLAPLDVQDRLTIEATVRRFWEATQDGLCPFFQDNKATFNANDNRAMRSVLGVRATLIVDNSGEPVFQVAAKHREAVADWLDRVKATAVKAAEPEVVARSFKGKIPAGRCSYCMVISDNLQRDHIVPVVQGGTDDPDNIVAACPDCNRRKHASSLLQFVARAAS